MSSQLSRIARLREGVLGALLADALGVPHEFKPGHQIPPAHTLELVMPASYPKTYSAIPYGTWSDDGSQLLCLLESLHAHNGQLNLRHLVGLMQAWLKEGHHQPGGVAFDVGGQTRHALERWSQGLPVEVHSRGQGNGSLMRTLPAAFLPALWGRTPEDAIQVALEQSLATHPHPVAATCCAVYTQLAMLLLDGHPQSAAEALQLAMDLVEDHPTYANQEWRAALVTLRGHGDLPTGSGYCVDTLYSAVWALDQGLDYLSVVRAAIGLGSDTDTTACVAGGLAGMVYGVQGEAEAWLPRLTTPRESRELLRLVFAPAQ